MNAKPNCPACLIEDLIKGLKKDTSLTPQERAAGIDRNRENLRKTPHEHPTKSRVRSS